MQAEYIRDGQELMVGAFGDTVDAGWKMGADVPLYENVRNSPAIERVMVRGQSKSAAEEPVPRHALERRASTEPERSTQVSLAAAARRSRPMAGRRILGGTRLLRGCSSRRAFSRSALGLVGVVAAGAADDAVPDPRRRLLRPLLARGSKRWLLDHPRFGPPLRAWRERGAIPPRAKATALAGSALGFLCFIWVSIRAFFRALCIGTAALDAAHRRRGRPCKRQSLKLGAATPRHSPGRRWHDAMTISLVDILVSPGKTSWSA